MTRAFLRGVDMMSLAGAAFAAVFLALICLLLFAEIATRLLFGTTLGNSWEFAAYFMSLTFLLGAAYTLRTGGHVRVSILRSVDKRRDAVIEFMASSVGLALAAFLALALTDLFWESFLRGITSATPARVPLALPRAGWALGAWLLALQLLARLVAIVTGEAIEKPAPDADVNT